MDEVLALVGDIYDASLDPPLWTGVLEKVTNFIPGCSAMLFSQDFVNRRGQFYFNWNDNPEYTRAFFEHYMKISPLTPHLMMTNVGDVFTASELMPYEELTASRFFQEWCVPQGYTDLVAVTLEKSATSMANFSVGRDVSQGLMDQVAIERMRLLTPHLRRAVLISKVIELHKLESAAFSDAFDGLAAGIFLVTAEGNVTYANESGAEMLESGDVLSSARGVLTVPDPQADRSLRGAFASAAEGDEGLATSGVAVPINTRSGELYLAHILSLASGARRKARFPYDAVAAVFVKKASFDLPSPIETAAKLFNLSPAEIRVLYAMIEVGGVSSVATMLGISEPTVKTHLQRLFQKTGMSRQADLVKLVAGFAGPLR